MSDISNEKRIRDILIGINKTECDDTLGWWETYDGANFGDHKMEALIKTFKYHLDPSEIYGFISYIITHEISNDLGIPDKEEASDILNRYIAQRNK